jgi:hypothetical protein
MKNHNRNVKIVDNAQDWVSLNTRDFMITGENKMNKNKDLQVLVYSANGKIQDVFVNDKNINVTVIDMDEIVAGSKEKLDLGDYPTIYANNARLQEEIDQYNEDIDKHMNYVAQNGGEDSFGFGWDK